MRNWQKYLLGGIAIGAALVSGFYILIYQPRTQKIVDATKFLDRAIPAISQDWSFAQLRSFSSPKLISLNPDADKMLIEINDKLGPMTKYLGCKYDRAGVDPSGDRPMTFLHFTSEVECEDGVAYLDLATTFEEGNWRLARFFVSRTEMRKAKR